ncbi:FGGY-family carbohydrate kinase [Streptomyces albidus (ex Kaewkla and Franco 2022)]|uniref:FGGY-family carbohydrate kinase n=1 Tax=Streptomyces albidus (ex Kaewkla and Franco 2022) TaxID=722709 RepID=UPI0015EF48AD|nr:FGGY family carbohydrate kinase [Streptomyces albidus (ex Kaewkla and Franco 2022)]
MTSDMHSGAGTARSPLLAGIDIGSTHCKALMCDPSGRVVARAQRPTPRSPDGLTHDAEELTGAALGALTDCVRIAERAPDAVGLTGMAETGVPLDRHGAPLGPVLSWSDPAPAAHADRLRRTYGAAALHARTGVLPSAKVPLARWCWLREHHPERLSRMRQWAGAADLVARALTGRVGTDATFAQRSMAWEHGTGGGQGRWNPDLLAEAGLTPVQMPHVHPPGKPVGTVTRDVARRLGLRAGAHVVVAGHDHLVGAWAAGARSAGTAADSMGTAEAVLTVSAAPPDLSAAAAEGMSWGRHADGEHWVTLAGMASSGALVEWFCDRFLEPLQEHGRHEPGKRYRAFARLVESSCEGNGRRPGPPTGITVEPYLDGRSAPRPDPAARLAVHGMASRHGPGHLALALLEGAAYQARWMADVQAELAGATPRTVTLLGGSTRQSTWTALKAAVTPWTTEVCAEPEAPCLGAAAWGGAAIGVDPSGMRPESTPLQVGGPAVAAHRAAYSEVFLPRVMRPTPPD